MSQPGELHTLGITRRVWQRVRTMMGFPQETRAVMGFWRHEVEGQKRADNGEKLSEVMRDPSVIVYTPAGFVGVHFPTRTRTRFVAGEPTDAEARQDGNYLGYYAALGLYPGGGHQGLIFHNILGGSMTAGTTLRRFFDLEGEVVHLTFPPTLNRQGIGAQLRQSPPAQRRQRYAGTLAARPIRAAIRFENLSSCRREYERRMHQIYGRA